MQLTGGLSYLLPQTNLGLRVPAAVGGGGGSAGQLLRAPRGCHGRRAA
eukprot:COSAG01_NODE_2365_length_7818_cov_13.978754_8_plen_47_part_01